MSDNEHTPASLWHRPFQAVHSDVLSVQHAVGEPIPEFCQPSEEGAKVPSSAAGQDTGDVLPYHPTGPIAVNQSKKDEGEVPTRIGKATP